MQTSNKTSVSALTSTGINPFGASFLSARLRIGLPRFAPALLGAVVAVACSTSALAQTEPTATATWTNTTSGTWGTTGNWSPAGAQNGSYFFLTAKPRHLHPLPPLTLAFKLW